jgi:hypothetical protein
MEYNIMRELNVNEIQEVNGGRGECLGLTFTTTVMGATIGGIAGGIASVGFGAVAGVWAGAGFGQQLGLALCSTLKLK